MRGPLFRSQSKSASLLQGAALEFANGKNLSEARIANVSRCPSLCSTRWAFMATWPLFVAVFYRFAVAADLELSWALLGHP